MHVIFISKNTIIFKLLCLGLCLAIVATCCCFFHILNGFTSVSCSAKTASGNPVQKGYIGKLAIIIDDFGQDRNGVKEMMEIKRHLTFAVMPFLDYSVSDARTAHEKGFEVIVHLPMEADAGKPEWVGPRPIISSMSDIEVQNLVSDAFANIPFSVGANIHMGTKISRDERIMSDILGVVRAKSKYFVDSLTTADTVAKKVASKKAVKFYERDIFIDGKNTTGRYVKEQLMKAKNLAIKTGKAIAIGHVGSEGGRVTAEAIRELLPEFDKSRVQLVFVSELR